VVVVVVGRSTASVPQPHRSTRFGKAHHHLLLLLLLPQVVAGRVLWVNLAALTEAGTRVGV
jgi:hypothetical protein